MQLSIVIPMLDAAATLADFRRHRVTRLRRLRNVDTTADAAARA